MSKTSSLFLCQVQKCPGECKSTPDDKQSFVNCLRKAFGDNFSVVKCGKVHKHDKDVLFCEMMVKCDQVPVREYLPDGFRIIAHLKESND